MTCEKCVRREGNYLYIYNDEERDCSCGVVYTCNGAMEHIFMESRSGKSNTEKMFHSNEVVEGCYLNKCLREGKAEEF